MLIIAQFFARRSSVQWSTRPSASPLAGRTGAPAAVVQAGFRFKLPCSFKRAADIVSGRLYEKYRHARTYFPPPCTRTVSGSFPLPRRSAAYYPSTLVPIVLVKGNVLARRDVGPHLFVSGIRGRYSSRKYVCTCTWPGAVPARAHQERTSTHTPEVQAPGLSQVFNSRL